ncbi:AraC family transcriptional regulator [Bradyrhizobium betae]|uniref:AraC family transcriptional regulator n=1 Tax=Bradyrhizobium betae TaxID=244734 RepID=UPI003D670C1E
MSGSGTITAAAAQELLVVLARRRPGACGVNARVGIPHAVLQDPQRMLPLVAFTSMLEAAACEFGNSTLGLELGKECRLSSIGPVSRLMQTARTAGDALEKFNRYFGSIQTDTQSTLSVSNGQARQAYAISDNAVRFRVQDAGFTLALEYSMLASFLGSDWQPSCVEFEHAAGDDLPFYRQQFDCPLRFEKRENALIFPARLLARPLRDADENLHARLEADLANTMAFRTRQLDFIESIEAWVASSLCRSDVTDIEVVAADFGMSERSFQRKLAACGINYLDIRNRVRSQIARCMLAESSLPVTSVALHLGYSETSAFSRGFKLQTGESPGEFRRRERIAA